MNKHDLQALTPAQLQDYRDEGLLEILDLPMGDNHTYDRYLCHNQNCPVAKFKDEWYMAENPVKAGFMRCGYVQFAQKFGESLKPYRGCPVGPSGVKGLMPGQKPSLIWSVIDYLQDAKDNVLLGPDESYICLPKTWYDICMASLQELQQAVESGALIPPEEARNTNEKPPHLPPPLDKPVFLGAE